MTSFTKKMALIVLLGSVSILAVACGGGKESATPMLPNSRAGKAFDGTATMKTFRGYKADSKLASGVAGATASITPSLAGADLFDASVRILLHSTSGELVGLSGSVTGLETKKARLLDLDAACSNSKFDIEVMCLHISCNALAVRVIEKPAANSPKISELEIGKAIPDTTGYAQTALIFAREIPVNTAQGVTAAQNSRARAAARRAKAAGLEVGPNGAQKSAQISDRANEQQLEQQPAQQQPVVAPGTLIKMVRRWSERWTSTADKDAAADVKTSFEEAVALAKGQGTNTAAVEACMVPAAATGAATAPNATTPAPSAPTTEPAAPVTPPGEPRGESKPASNGTSEISENPLN
jgi:hypothetical protein